MYDWIMNNQTAIQLVSLVVTVLVILGGFVFWAGRIDGDINGLDVRLGAQEQRIEKRFDSLEQQISDLDVDIEDRIEAYDYHGHTADGAVVFTLSPRSD